MLQHITKCEVGMAKKLPTPEPQSAEDGKVSLQLRLEAELHERLRKTAEEAGISLNQLIQGICWGVVDKVVQGEAKRSPDGFVHWEMRKKCLFFGCPGSFNDPDGRDPTPEYLGEYWFGLDFTNRGVVR